jgi:DNA-3-methyladenine glycosylase
MAAAASAKARATEPLCRGTALARAFYERDTLEVARDLLGKVLVLSTPDGECAGRIVETEAYRGDDPASHSARGETPRAAIMFGEPGVAYVYFIYGMYEMLNFVTEPKGQAGAVLIRALEPLRGEALMQRRRALGRASSAKPLRAWELASGPGKLCRAMGVLMRHNGASLDGPELFVRDDGFEVASISVSPRVGITAAKEQPWRFFVTGNPCVSRAPQNAQAAIKRPAELVSADAASGRTSPSALSEARQARRASRPLAPRPRSARSKAGGA